MKGGSFTYSSGDSDFYPDGSSFIEASDVSGLSDGTTWSKHYNGGLYGRVKDCMSNAATSGFWVYPANTMQSIMSECPRQVLGRT